MISGISLALGLVFLFILIVDRPYTGEFSVRIDELAHLSSKFDLLDRLSSDSGFLLEHYQLTLARHPWRIRQVHHSVVEDFRPAASRVEEIGIVFLDAPLKWRLRSIRWQDQ